MKNINYKISDGLVQQRLKRNGVNLEYIYANEKINKLFASIDGNELTEYQTKIINGICGRGSCSASIGQFPVKCIAN